MHIHILGICGTFMGGLALLAKEMGYTVSGSDNNVYPPMSVQLEQAGIILQEGYDPSHLQPEPDQVVIGNTLSRGNACIEYVLNRGLDYTSGPQWLSQHILPGRHVIAVSGTHGKTTTTSVLAWLLDKAGMEPGFLIGGVAENFGVSARIGGAKVFVVEADEYDTAFFDKRSKFIHYRPKTLIINNIEFDHADIFDDIDAIKREFHHLLRTLPGEGTIIARGQDDTIKAVLEMGCWTPVQTFGVASEEEWTAQALSDDYSRFQVLRLGALQGTVEWELIGRHNAENALAAIAAAAQAGADTAAACAALSEFKSVKRRLQLLANVNGIRVYDDFAHHPTAIAATLGALRQKVGQARIITILEPRSNTMKMGVHRHILAAAFKGSDRVLLYQHPDAKWELSAISQELGKICSCYMEIEEIIGAITAYVRAGDHVVIMSNGAFDNIHHRLIEALG